ncbi:MAG: alpha/beta hydrolase fold domain-containing protein [Verrucomicrobiota bacterium]
MRPLLFLVLATSISAQAEIDVFTSLDADHDGKLSAGEVPGAMREHFRQFDKDGDGLITREEQSRVLTPAAAPVVTEQLRNVDYVGNGNPRQTLDLLLPEDHASKKRPLVVFIHGGAWNSGKKEDGLPVIRMLSSTGDYVTATLNYRLSQEASWPAQIFDCKAAIRFLRGKAGAYGIDPANIGIIGMSAGGHLVSMLGTSGGIASLEGDLGPFPKLSSRVRCVVNFFGPTDFLTMSGDSLQPNPVTALLGGIGPDLREKAKQASPVTWVTKDSAPFFTAHGTRDPLVPFAQAEEINAALAKAGVESHLIAMQGAGHGFSNATLNQRIKQFLDNHLRQQNGQISDEPIPVQ